MTKEKPKKPVSSKLYEDLLAMLPQSITLVDVFMEGKWLAVIADNGMKIKIKDK